MTPAGLLALGSVVCVVAALDHAAGAPSINTGVMDRMSMRRRTTLEMILPAASMPPGGVGEPEATVKPRSHERARAVIPMGFAILLLVLATTSQGAFATSRWA